MEYVRVNGSGHQHDFSRKSTDEHLDHLEDHEENSVDFMQEQIVSDNVPLMTLDSNDTFRDRRGCESGSERLLPSPQDFAEDNPRTRFFDLTRTELWHLFLLFLLYYSQGIPVGLVAGAVPMVLKPYLSYGRVGLFSMAFYPFSLKLLWSPLIDSLWIERFGRRKTWIVPTLILSGLTMMLLGHQTNKLLQSIEEFNTPGLLLYVATWTFLLFLSATQGCAVDGLTLSLLPLKVLPWASSAHNLGIVCGEFTANSLFLFFNTSGLGSPVESRPGPEVGGMISLGAFVMSFGGIFCTFGVFLAFAKAIDSPAKQASKSVMVNYTIILQLLRKSPIQEIIVIHLLARIGFEINDVVTLLKLLDKGFGQANIAIVRMVDIPFNIISSCVAGFLCARLLPLKVWSWAFVIRLFTAMMGQVTIFLYPLGSIPPWYYLLVVLEHILSTSLATTMYVAFLVFHLQVSDPSVGGIYMTLLATAQNIGGTVPLAGLMKLIQVTTDSSCVSPSGHNDTIAVKSLSSGCAIPAERESCEGSGGQCIIATDGYYFINTVAIILGGLTFLWIGATASRLQKLPRSDWLLKQ